MQNNSTITSLPFSILALLGMLVAIGPLAIDMYLPALPVIASDLSVSIDRVQQTLAIFLGGFAICQLIYGPLSDQFGRRPVLLGGVALYSIISFLCTQVSSVETLMWMRLLQALGGGAAAVVVMAIVRDQFNGREAARIMSLVMTVMVMTPLFAPLLGGWFLLIWSWHSLFWFMGIFGTVVFLWGLIQLQESHPYHLRQDMRPAQMWKNAIKILQHKQAMGYILSSSFAFGVMFAFIAGSPFVYIEYFGVSPEHYGLLFGANVIMMLILNWINGHKVKTLGIARLVQTGLFVQLIATSLLFVVALIDGGIWFFIPLVVISVGVVGLLAANTMAAAMTPFGEFAGFASAFFGTIRFVMAALSISCVSLLHNQTVIPMVLVMFGCSLLAATVFLVMVKNQTSLDD